MKNTKMFVVLGVAVAAVAVGAFTYFSDGQFQGNLNRVQLAPQQQLTAQKTANGVDRFLHNGQLSIYGVTVSANNADGVLNTLTFAVNGDFDLGDALNQFTLVDENNQPVAFRITNRAGQDITNNAVDVTGNNAKLQDKLTVFLPTSGVKILANTSKTFYLKATLFGASAGNTLSTGLVGLNRVNTVLPRHDMSF